MNRFEAALPAMLLIPFGLAFVVGAWILKTYIFKFDDRTLRFSVRSNYVVGVLLMVAGVIAALVTLVTGEPVIGNE